MVFGDRHTWDLKGQATVDSSSSWPVVKGVDC